MIAELTHSLARPANEADMPIPENLTPGPKNLTLILCTPNQLFDVTRHCRAHAIPITSKLSDMQASVFARDVGDLRNIIALLANAEPSDHRALPPKARLSLRKATSGAVS
jgi:hypothetical protein